MRDHAWSWFISYKTTCISFIVHSGTIKIPRCNLICRICWALSSDYDKREVREDGGQGPKMWTVNTSLYILQLLYPQKRYLSTIALFHQNVCKVRGCANCVALQDFWDLPPFRHRSKAFAIVCIRYIIIYAVEIERLKDWNYDEIEYLLLVQCDGRIPVLWMAALVEFSEFAQKCLWLCRAQHHGRHNTPLICFWVQLQNIGHEKHRTKEFPSYQGQIPPPFPLPSLPGQGCLVYRYINFYPPKSVLARHHCFSGRFPVTPVLEALVVILFLCRPRTGMTCWDDSHSEAETWARHGLHPGLSLLDDRGQLAIVLW